MEKIKEAIVIKTTVRLGSVIEFNALTRMSRIGDLPTQVESLIDLVVHTASEVMDLKDDGALLKKTDGQGWTVGEAKRELAALGAAMGEEVDV